MAARTNESREENRQGRTPQSACHNGPLEKIIMTSGPPPEREFTLREANKMLPLVGVIVADWVALCHHVVERERWIEETKAHRMRVPREADPYADEVAEVQRELTRSRARLEEYLQELRELGISPGDGESVHFWAAASEGPRQFFCWRLEDPEIQFQHAADEPCKCLRPIATEPVPVPPLDSNSEHAP